MRVGFLLFPDITQLDLTGPYEVFASLPDTRVHLIWKTLDPVAAVTGMKILPDTLMSECPQLDVLCVPGGPGMGPLMIDDQVLDFIRKQSKGARYTTSVCTGALVLGAAGLLKGKRAATHWMSMSMLAPLGATPVDERVVVDGNIITGGGVTAGIDFALRVVAELRGVETAQAVQLRIEYQPAPPFDAGSPRTAPQAIVEKALANAAPMIDKRNALVETAARKLKP
ncbi:MAG: DJ-1/PfpI family protein [Burkholderiales bacterium]|nr:DJ-1/PfpI family protein [Burkholderiales bacterium]